MSRNNQKALLHSGMDGLIIPELRLHCLTGGSYLDICALTGIVISYFYKIIWETADAVNDCQRLDLVGIPTNIDEAGPLAYGFEEYHLS